jgi:hypothetical protein
VHDPDHVLELVRPPGAVVEPAVTLGG